MNAHPFAGKDPDGFCAICQGAMEHPDHGPASLGPSWRPDPHRPGYYHDPRRRGWLRDREGRWYDAREVDGVRREVDDAVSANEATQIELVEGLRRAARDKGLIP